MVENPAASKLITLLIPCAAYHLNAVGRAFESARAQTLPCEVLVIEDLQGDGAGAARNRGLALVNTPLVSFLDADDWLEPDFAAQMVAHYQPGCYVYCDCWRGDDIHHTPDCGAYTLPKSWHAVNALVVTEHARHIGGFDEHLPAIEDRDFFLRLQAVGVCGVRCPAPLVHYSGLGQRSEAFKVSRTFAETRDLVNDKSLERARQMCICTDPPPDSTPGSQQEGDILVRAATKLHTWRGKATGREYPRPKGVHNYTLWVHPADAMKEPAALEIVNAFDPRQHSPDLETIRQMALEALGP